MSRIWLVVFWGVAVPASVHAQLCENISEPMPTGNETLFAQLGGVQLVQRELTPPCVGFDASIIEARTTIPGSTIGTLTNLRLEGVHQLWSSVGLEPSIYGPAPSSALFNQDWSYLDSHLLITKDMILGGVYTMSETNDGSTSSAISLPPMLNGASTPRGGYGTIAMGKETDAFALQRDFFTDRFDLAYVVTQADAPAPSRLTAGILGDGIASDGKRYGSTLAFGYDGNPEITFLPFVPVEPTVVPPTPEPLPTAIGSVISPTSYSETYEGIGGIHVFQVPVEVAPAPDNDFAYSVGVVEIEVDGDVINSLAFGDLIQNWGKVPGFLAPTPIGPHGEGIRNRYQFSAGSDGVLPVAFFGNVEGSYDASYKFTFNDGSVVDAMLTANITEANPGLGGIGEPRPTPTVVDCSGMARRPLPENGFLVAEEGCVELISIPVEVGHGLMATKLVARGVDPEASLVTLTNISISNAHQVWAGGGIQSAGGTAVGKPHAGPTYHEDWIPLDSHLLISDEMIGGGIGEISETNDGASPLGESLPTALGIKPITGLGTVSMSDEKDAFFLKPENQSNMLEIAYVVSDGSEPIEMTLGILGAGIRDAGTENGAVFGYGDGVATMSIPLSASQAAPEPSGRGLVLLASVLSVLLRRRDG